MMQSSLELDKLSAPRLPEGAVARAPIARDGTGRVDGPAISRRRLRHGISAATPLGHTTPNLVRPLEASWVGEHNIPHPPERARYARFAHAISLLEFLPGDTAEGDGGVVESDRSGATGAGGGLAECTAAQRSAWYRSLARKHRRIVAVAHDDRHDVALFNVDSGERLGECTTHGLAPEMTLARRPVSVPAFAPGNARMPTRSGAALATGTSDGRIRVHDPYALVAQRSLGSAGRASILGGQVEGDSCVSALDAATGTGGLDNVRDVRWVVVGLADRDPATIAVGLDALLLVGALGFRGVTVLRFAPSERGDGTGEGTGALVVLQTVSWAGSGGLASPRVIAAPEVSAVPSCSRVDLPYFIVGHICDRLSLWRRKIPAGGTAAASAGVDAEGLHFSMDHYLGKEAAAAGTLHAVRMAPRFVSLAPTGPAGDTFATVDGSGTLKIFFVADDEWGLRMIPICSLNKLRPERCPWGASSHITVSHPYDVVWLHHPVYSPARRASTVERDAATVATGAEETRDAAGAVSGGAAGGAGASPAEGAEDNSAIAIYRLLVAYAGQVTIVEWNGDTQSISAVGHLRQYPGPTRDIHAIAATQRDDLLAGGASCDLLVWDLHVRGAPVARAAPHHVTLRLVPCHVTGGTARLFPQLVRAGPQCCAQ